MNLQFDRIQQSINICDEKIYHIYTRVQENKEFSEEKIKQATSMISDQKALHAFIEFEKERCEINGERIQAEFEELYNSDRDVIELKDNIDEIISRFHLDGNEVESYEAPDTDEADGTFICTVKYVQKMKPTSIFDENVLIQEHQYMIPYFKNPWNPLFMYASCDMDTTKEACGLFNDFIQRWLSENRVRNAQAIIIDPVNRGCYLGTTMNLIGDNDLDICTYYKNEEEISQIINSLTEHVDMVLAKLTMDAKENVRKYNDWADEAGEKCIPYKTLVINDFPVGFRQESIKKLEIIINKAAVCGINVLISHRSKETMSIGSYDDLAQKLYDEYLSEFVKVEMAESGNTITFDEKTYSFERIPVKVSSSYLQGLREEYGKKPTIKNDFNSFFATNDVQMLRKKMGDCVKKLSIPFAVSENGESISLELDSDNATFGLITGGTGSGKTTLLHMLITSAVMHYSPRDLQLWLIDYKNIEFRQYAKMNNAPHIRYLIADDSNEISYDFIRLLKAEFKRRKDLFNEVGANSFKAYRATGRELPRLLVIVDESHRLAEAAQEDSNCQKDIHDLFAEVRSTGINILLCDQHKSSAMKGFTKETEKAISVRIAMRNDKIDIQETLNLDYKDINEDESLRQTIEDTSIAKQGVLIYRKEVSCEGDTNKKQYITARAIFMNDSEKADVIAQANAIDSEYPAVLDYYLGEGRMPMDMGRILDYEKNNPLEYGRDRFYIGTPNGIQYGFYLNLDNVVGENILLAGSDREMKYAIVKGMIESAVRNGYRIVLLGWLKTQFFKQYPGLFVDDVDKNIVSYTKRGDICKFICQTTVKLENFINADDDDDDEEEDVKTLVIIPGMEELWKKLEVLPKTRRDILDIYNEKSEEPVEIKQMQEEPTGKASKNEDLLAQFADSSDRLRMLLQMGMEAELADDEDRNGLMEAMDISKNTPEVNESAVSKSDAGEESSNSSKSEDKMPSYNATKDLEQLISKGYVNNLHMLCMVDTGMFVRQFRIFETGFNHRIAVPNVVDASSVIAHDRALTKLIDDRITTDAIYEYMRGRAQIFKPYEF